MSAKIEELKESGDIMTFTLTGVDACYANGIRRVILSEIPVVVFKTYGYVGIHEICVGDKLLQIS